MNNIVAIVGRPNVGKSTFFNRLVGERQAIMDDQSGVTRDRHYGHSEWCGKYFTVIDTGGYVTGSDDTFEAEIRRQVDLAIQEATVILFLVDAAAGLHFLDEEFANKIRHTKKPILLVVNKADNNHRLQMAGEFYALGLGEIYPISSQNGTGTGELLDEVIRHFDDPGVEDPDAGIPKISILGRPNVGKSSFVNALLGTQRSIVTDIAGTTRDAINARYNSYGQEFIIVDTAGIRKKSKISEDVEFYSTLRSIKALEESDVCVVLLDAERGLESQDMNIIWNAHNNKKGLVILVNKWDLIEKDHKTAKAFEDRIREGLKPIHYPPIMFISVLNKVRLFQAVEVIMKVYENRTKKIATSHLNDTILPYIEHYPPPIHKGKQVKIKYCTQLPTRTPTFAFFCNLPQYVSESYTRYLENKIREHYDFAGVPIQVVYRKK
ncbi:MAG: ribosome biogenesis GTPase Der [Cytophagaceae bacterium]|jgi:GTP-binding protein|nr:ribosome biogenesis GTPase Der [Cytophagaceae bacterium]